MFVLQNVIERSELTRSRARREMRALVDKFPEGLQQNTELQEGIGAHVETAEDIPLDSEIVAGEF
jgi:hypothetical protein